MAKHEIITGPEDAANALRERIDAAPMSRAQILAIGITFLLSALDGYDLLAMSFAAPAVSAAWGISQAALGITLGAGLAGMAVGSLLFAPLADIVGRKAMVLLALMLMAAGMLGAAFSPSISVLMFWRVFTGLGIGTCVAVLNGISAEFANARRRTLCVAITAIGVPIGGGVGGLASSLLLHHFGWQAVFLAGFVLSLAMIPVVAILLPESFSFLLTSRRSDAMDRLNRLLQRCGHDCVDVVANYGSYQRRGYSAVFAPTNIGKTLWITSIFACLMVSTYYLLSWLPQMLADFGFSASVASLVLGTVSLTGVIGGLTLGWLAQRTSLRALFTTALVGFGLSTIILGLVPASFPAIIVVGGICGFFLFGAGTGAFATLATTFGDTARASGTGFVVGVGRVASAASPTLAGGMFTLGLSHQAVSSIFGLVSLFAAAILFFGWRRFRR